MAVRTSQTPRGSRSQSEFDAMLRQEIARSRGRGGETDTQGARDRLAKRLNAQEGRSRNSSAYRPGRDRGSSTQGRQSRGGAKTKGGGGTRGAPAPKGADVPIPTPRPDTTAPDTGSPGMDLWWLPMLLAAANKRGQGMMGQGQPEFLPPGPKPVPVQTTKEPLTIDNSVLKPQRLLNAPPNTQALAYQPSLPPPPTGDSLDAFMLQSDAPRNLTADELLKMRLATQQLSAMESGAAGDVGARIGGNVFRPGVSDAVTSPGMYGSKYGQSILKHFLP